MSKNLTAPKKRLFGRNLFTLVVVALAFIIVFLGIFITTQYVSTYNKNKITPYVTKTVGTNFEEGTYNTNDVVRMNGKDFNELGLIFSCTNFVDEKSTKSATYELRTYLLDDSKNINGKLTANVCFANDWVGYVAYSSKSSTITVAKDKETAEGSTTYRKTFTISTFGDYPAKTDTWPIKITVSKPVIYLYLSYSYYENGENKTDNFILKYTYDELIPNVGGIKK